MNKKDFNKSSTCSTIKEDSNEEFMKSLEGLSKLKRRKAIEEDMNNRQFSFCFEDMHEPHAKKKGIREETDDNDNSS